jgi:hypothetical protein
MLAPTNEHSEEESLTRMSEPTPAKENEPASVTFFFEKTNDFRTAHADGVLGSMTPTGQVFLAFYVERAPIPKTVVHAVNPDSTLGEVKSVTGKQGVYREIQSAVILTPEGLRDLKDHIEKLLKNFPSPSSNG